MAQPSIRPNGAKIRMERMLAGWNSGEFALHVGTNPANFSKIEHGRVGTSPAMLKRIADALGLTVRDLIHPDAMPAGSQPKNHEAASAAT